MTRYDCVVPRKMRADDVIKWNRRIFSSPTGYYQFGRDLYMLIFIVKMSRVSYCVIFSKFDKTSFDSRNGETICVSQSETICVGRAFDQLWYTEKPIIRSIAVQLSDRIYSSEKLRRWFNQRLRETRSRVYSFSSAFLIEIYTFHSPIQTHCGGG